MAAAKLLLADDSVTIQRVIELTFADEDVQVVAVGDGKAAIERVQADRPDIVLADIGMPERDGYEVAEFIKGRPDLSHIPVLLLTGAFEPIDEARARAVGCEGVLVKPFEPQMVISRVRELLNRVAPSSARTPAAAPPPAAAPEPPAASSPGKGEALEDYFDRLDAALATLNTAPPPLEVIPREPEPAAPPARPSPSEPARPAAAPAPPPPAPPAGHAAARPQEAPAAAAVADAAALVEIPAALPALHEAFAALLSAERGQPVVPAPAVRESITDEVIEDIVRRVLARMGDDDMRRAVLDTAERLVREEIDRVKRAER